MYKIIGRLMLDGMTVADAPYVGFAAEALNPTVTR